MFLKDKLFLHNWCPLVCFEFWYFNKLKVFALWSQVFAMETIFQSFFYVPDHCISHQMIRIRTTYFPNKLWNFGLILPGTSKLSVKFLTHEFPNESLILLCFKNSMEFRGVPFKATSKTGPVQYFEITENPKNISAPFEDRVKFLELLNLLKPTLL